MKDKTKENHQRRKIISCIGGLLALGFYIISCVMVSRNNAVAREAEKNTDSKVKTITIAHWQLEDGFREAIDYAIKEFEKLKAEQGEQVKVIQSTVPIRGYTQWFTTQLISGNPADLIEIIASADMQSRYFIPLSNYVAKPNPFNKGTFAENIPWKDTYVDGMDYSINPVFSEYFGVGIFHHVTRVYVNLDLLQAATGSDKVPENYGEWLDCCRKLDAYGKKIGKPIIPIGVRGIGKATVSNLTNRYFGEFNNDYHDRFSRFGKVNCTMQDLLIAMSNDELDMKRMMIPIRMVRDIGKYFSEGFTTTDSEQTKFLFFTGNVGFFPDGTWAAWTMINNSPFRVAITRVPSAYGYGELAKYFKGRTYESGLGASGKIGITRASKHPELALEFLQFLTSWKMNQKTMMDFCKWPPVVINSEYKGVLEPMAPFHGDSKRSISIPFSFNSRSNVVMLEAIEKIITEQDPEPEKTMLRAFRKNVPLIRDELMNVTGSDERLFFDLEASRNTVAAGLMRSDLSADHRSNQEFRMMMSLENATDRYGYYRLSQDALNALKNIDRVLDKYENENLEVKRDGN